MKAIILAAGVGSRLGMPFPKSLNRLPNGETIIGRQIRILRENNIQEIIAVVGFKMHFIMEKHPDIFYCYNPFYYVTNTAKSLLSALEYINEDVIWLNGDTIFDPEVIEKLKNTEGNAVCVNRTECGEEEVKYTLNEEGYLAHISKTIRNGLGEAVGINKISEKDIGIFKKNLAVVNSDDYFEKAIEISINEGIQFVPCDISEYRCIEIDFNEDWEKAVAMFSE